MIVKRVAREVASTLATNGFRELNHTEYGGVSDYGYIRTCLIATAYNALRAMDGFGYSLNEFHRMVEDAEKLAA
jgi:hypothetical protein